MYFKCIFAITIAVMVWNNAYSQSSLDTDTGSVYPGKDWSIRNPEDLGFSTKKLNAAKAAFEKSGGVAALVVVKGHIIAEWGDTRINFDCRSIRKSLLNSVIGIHVKEGRINTEATLDEIGFQDGSKLTSSELETSIEDLLASSSGIYLPAAFEEQTNVNKPERGSHEPGTHFFYNNWDFNALSTITNQMAREDLFETFNERIAKPLGMEYFNSQRNGAYIHQPWFSDHPAYLFRISTRDLARYGLLYLNNGNWEGLQILPRDWVLSSTTQQIETGEKFYYNYGFLWWVTKGENPNVRTPFLARGAQSQFMHIDPANDLIFIFRDNPDDLTTVRKSTAYPLIGHIYRAMEG